MATLTTAQAAADTQDFMLSHGVHLRPEWIAHCLAEHDVLGGTQSAKEAIYRIFLLCDLREAGEACLPAGVGEMVKQRLRGKMVIQVETTGASRSCRRHTYLLSWKVLETSPRTSSRERRRTADRRITLSRWLLETAAKHDIGGQQVAALIEARRAATSDTKIKGGTDAVVETQERQGSVVAAETPARSGREKKTDGSSRRALQSCDSQIPARTGNEGRSGGDVLASRSQRDGHDGVRGEGASNGASETTARRRREANTNVTNPYAGLKPASMAPERTDKAGTVRNDEAGSDEALREKGISRSSRERNRRLLAFRDSDADEPQFEYLEEPDFENFGDEQPPPDEAPRTVRRGDVLSERIRPTSTAPPTPMSSHFGSATHISEQSPVAVTPRPKIVTARAQHEAHKDRGKRSRGDRSVLERHHVTVSGSGDDTSRRKRGRTHASDASRGPFASLVDLGGMNAAGRTHRVKAVVSDTMGCKLRKKKYLLVIEIEDGTAVLRVRLSDDITLRLFGVDAREFKKIIKADQERGMAIQARVEQDIRSMEGAMEIDFGPVIAASPSPADPSTPGTSQGSSSGDVEWSLPVLTSVSPPTREDCGQLLTNVQGLI